MEKPDKQAQWFGWVKMAMSVTQMGLSLITPLVLLVLLTFWIQKKFSLGSWIVLIGLALGLVSMGITFYRIYQGILKQSQNKKNKLPEEEKNDSDE